MINDNANNRRPRSHIRLIIATGIIILLAVIILPAASLKMITSSRPRVNFVSFNPASYKGATGKILLQYRGKVVMTLQDVSAHPSIKIYNLEGSNGKVVAPAGSFKVVNIGLYAAANGKDKGRIYARPQQSSISIPRNGSVRLKIGPPYTARVTVSGTSGGKATMTLMMTDAGNNACTFYGANYKAPKFKVMNQAGKAVWEGTFKYG